MTVKLNYKELVRYLVKDETQRESLEVLSKKRELPQKVLLKRGIFCVFDTDELSFLLEEWNLTFEDAFGKETDQVRLLNEGFIIPVLDSSYRIMFFVNYNWERGSGRKYLNVYPDSLSQSATNMKMFGAHNLSQAVKEDWIVVVEGIFDCIRLEHEGIPAVSIMGTKLLEYHKRFLNRFTKVIYISDADFEGYKGWQNVQKGLDNVIHYPIKGLSKDVDEFATRDTRGFAEWLDGLKDHMPIKNRESS